MKFPKIKIPKSVTWDMVKEEILHKKETRAVELEGKTKATLELLIHEIQQCKDMGEVRSLVDSWIKPNDLHPEKVQTMVINKRVINKVQFKE